MIYTMYSVTLCLSAPKLYMHRCFYLSCCQSDISDKYYDVIMDVLPLRIVSWNMKGFKAVNPYTCSLLNDNDIYIVSEHHLFEWELGKQ